MDELTMPPAKQINWPPFSTVLGTQTFSPTYQFTDKTALVETAEAILEMGSNTLKLGLSHTAINKQYRLPEDPQIQTIRDLLAIDPSYQAVLAMPFDFYLFWAYPLTVAGNWHNGQTPQDRENEYREIYELTAWLLETFSGTGKSFLLGHWEGDWSLTGAPYAVERDPDPQAVRGMIEWLNVRQQAVDDARRAASHHDVHVWHYTEVNLVRKALAGRGLTLTNDVLPHTQVDLVSYSSYDSLELGEGEAALAQRLKESLDFIESRLPAKPLDWEGKRVFIGEYGFPLRQMQTPEAQDHWSRVVAAAGLEWGCPFVLYWEIYNNEVLPESGQSGFWMIDDRGVKQPVYWTHSRFYERAQEFVENFRRHHGRNPRHSEFGPLAATWLS